MMNHRVMAHSSPVARRLAIIRQRLNFTGSEAYWERRYKSGQTSGSGSYGTTAHLKAEFLNVFVRDHNIASVVEFGCGDGNQLSLAEYPCYIGLDVSRSAVGLCRNRFTNDKTRSFYLYDGDCFIDNANLFSAELAISLDVIYHLIEENVYRTYMEHLFNAAQKYVIIFSTDSAERSAAPHVRHRRFSSWIAAERPDWHLMQHIPGIRSKVSQADFFVYRRLSDDCAGS